ncbi:hypothetical protein [Burkholderia cepacia]|uniref:hypothetical protein n=1 Tax=Burkholderia cepacia TaxID=292 RepID=UPI001F3564CC|nr:hypothetical protein [Burkholderia cepacia]UIY58116.1 hypothetical protein LZ568_07850 [Burkholderia cepacia]
MRISKKKRELSLESVYDFLVDKRPMSFREIRCYFDGTDEEIEETLRLGVRVGSLAYEPPRLQKLAGWYQAVKDKNPNVAGPRISPLSVEKELSYDLYSLEKLSKSFRRQ